jgi:hypothetical protein
MLMQKLPLIGDHFVKEIPPSDNVRFHFPGPLYNISYILSKRIFAGCDGS